MYPMVATSKERLGIFLAIVGGLSLLIGLAILSNQGVRNEEPTVREDNKLSSNVLITAAHLEKVDGYKLLYKDGSRDVAYYIKENVSLSIIQPQPVTIDGLQDCKITSSYEGGFTVETSRTDLIHSGLSGTRVKDLGGQDIGFISALLKDGKIDCKTLE